MLPMTWNSDGPFFVWQAVGSSAIAANARLTSSGHS